MAHDMPLPCPPGTRTKDPFEQSNHTSPTRMLITPAMKRSSSACD
jgi:hypothetical protein